MKIVSSGRVLNSKEFYEKKQKRKRLHLILFAVLFFSILIALIYFSRQEQFLITEVTVQREDVIDKDKIAERVRGALAGYYLWIIPRANALVYPRRGIEQQLLAEFPRFKSVDLNLDGLRAITISVEERIPFALYCTTTTECFFLDEEGYIFALAPSFSGVVYFIYTTETLIENPIGKNLMPVDTFKSLPKFIEELSLLGIHPTALAIGNDDYILSLPNKGEIIWRRSDDLALVRSNLEAFLSSESIRAQSDFLDKISRLDLRTENKVFYRFK